MRVIAGERKGFPLKTPPGMNTRPTTDKVKESIFNMIGPYFDGGLVLDLFAGSGSLGIEALSRGADKAIFVEKDGKAFQVLQDNIKKCRYEQKSELYKTDAARAVKALIKRDIVLDYVFLDPPYKKVEYYDFVLSLISEKKISNEGVIVCEHSSDVQLPEQFHQFSRKKQEIYGDSVISIYQM